MWFPTEERIVRSHRGLLEAGGGEPGILSEGAIRSAVERARWGPFRYGGDIHERAALLVIIIAQEHPFVDGNKRTAYETMGVFLSRNGWELEVDASDAVPFLLRVAQGEDLGSARRWIKEHARKR